MVSVKISTSGNFDNMEKFLKKGSSTDHIASLAKSYAQKGVDLLARDTPKDTGLTASSWGYEIKQTNNSVTIYFTNSHVEKGYARIAILLQYGHATRNGGWVEGRDYINPALQETFQGLANEFFMEVTRS